MKLKDVTIMARMAGFFSKTIDAAKYTVSKKDVLT
jgi:hypothetical protein